MDKMALPIGPLDPSTATRVSNASDTSLYSNTPPYEVPGRATRRHSNVFDWSQLLAESQVRGRNSYKRHAGSLSTASTLAEVTLGLRNSLGLAACHSVTLTGWHCKVAGAAHLLALHLGEGLCLLLQVAKGSSAARRMAARRPPLKFKPAANPALRLFDSCTDLCLGPPQALSTGPSLPSALTTQEIGPPAQVVQ